MKLFRARIKRTSCVYTKLMYAENKKHAIEKFVEFERVLKKDILEVVEVIINENIRGVDV